MYGIYAMHRLIVSCFLTYQHICIGSTVVLQLLFLGHFLVSTGYSALIISNSVLPCFFLTMVYIISGDTSILKFVS